MSAHNEIVSIWNVANGWHIHARASSQIKIHEKHLIVLVHGLGASSCYMEPLIRILGDTHQVFAPDLPGCGRSDAPDKSLEITELADALAAWMDSAGISDPVVVGNSLGCQIAVEFAIRHPEKVSSIVLLAPTVDPSARNLFIQAGRLLLDSLQEPLSLIPILTFDYLRAGLIRTLQTSRMMIRHRIEERMSNVPVPVLVIRGTNDPIVPDYWSVRAVEAMPYGKLTVIPGAAHSLNYSAPLEVSRIIRHFLHSST